MGCGESMKRDRARAVLTALALSLFILSPHPIGQPSVGGIPDRISLHFFVKFFSYSFKKFFAVYLSFVFKL